MKKRRFWGDMNPTLRGFLIIALIALIVIVLNLYTALATAAVLLRVAFFLAVAFFVYLLWRERREEIGGWSTRARTVFYGAGLLVVADLGVYFWRGVPGYDALAFVAVIAFSGFAMWRVWRDERTYGSG